MMRWPVKYKMNSTKTPDIVSGENADTMIGHYWWEGQPRLPGTRRLYFLHFCGENAAVTYNIWATWECPWQLV